MQIVLKLYLDLIVANEVKIVRITKKVHNSQIERMYIVEVQIIRRMFTSDISKHLKVI